MSSRKIFQREDWLVALIATVVSGGVYFYTAAPNVTLLDSGEFLVAAMHFGVPHPTGYPLWTLLSWLFTLLPLGNGAWEVAIFSGICAALAVGLTALVASSMLLALIPPNAPKLVRLIRPCTALTASLLLAFSVSMWSQAVIAEVYALHALLIGCFLTLLYCWTLRTNRIWLMLGAFFVLALSFSNHHLTLTLSPLPFFLILLLRRRAFWDWVMAALATVLIVFLGFALLSGDPLVLRTAIRFFYCGGVAFAIFLWLRRFRIRWNLIAFLPFAVIMGLLPYLYMPLASGTNPPMNWGYTREASGFFFSINRSQYSGSLSEQTIKTLGRLMGTYPGEAQGETKEVGRPSKISEFQLWAGFFWTKIIQSFTPIGLIAYFCSVLAIFSLPLARRAWIYLLHLSFVLAAFLQPLMDSAVIDNTGWWLQMPYHTYTNLIFALLCSIGMAFLLFRITAIRPRFTVIAPLLFILPIITLIGNADECSQRGRWFGWTFGYDMLKDLPKGSVMVGGSDPGRFVPTYMIFGESPQEAKFKRDPSFDRRDLYVITQNALGETNYMKYLRDQYTKARPLPKNDFEKWLGREHTYPEKPLLFPTEQESDAVYHQVEDMVRNGEVSPNDMWPVITGYILKWLWEKNRNEHAFFVEELFPIKWTYDYAIPHGLIYEIGKTKMDKLPPEVVARDFAFWKNYKQKLLADPEYHKDYDAQRSFSKLRTTIANIYQHKEMQAEAERAYLEALELWPENSEALFAVSKILSTRGDYPKVVELFNRAIEKDPQNVALWKVKLLVEERQKVEGEIQNLTEQLARQPKNREIITKLLDLYARMEDTEKADKLIEGLSKDFPGDVDILRTIGKYYAAIGDLRKTLGPAQQLVTLESGNPRNHLNLARAYFALGNKEEFYKTARKALELGGLPIRNELVNDPLFEPWKNDQEFKLLESPGPNRPPQAPATSSTGAQEQKTLRSP